MPRAVAARAAELQLVGLPVDVEESNGLDEQANVHGFECAECEPLDAHEVADDIRVACRKGWPASAAFWERTCVFSCR